MTAFIVPLVFALAVKGEEAFGKFELLTELFTGPLTKKAYGEEAKPKVWSAKEMYNINKVRDAYSVPSTRATTNTTETEKKSAEIKILRDKMFMQNQSAITTINKTSQDTKSNSSYIKNDWTNIANYVTNSKSNASSEK